MGLSRGASTGDTYDKGFLHGVLGDTYEGKIKNNAPLERQPVASPPSPGG